MRLVVALFILGTINHLPWHLVGVDNKGLVFQMGSAFSNGVLLLVVWAQNVKRYPKTLTVVCAAWLFEDFLVVACGAWHLLDPPLIPAPVGDEMCREHIGFNLLNASLVATGFIAAMLLDRIKNNAPTITDR